MSFFVSVITAISNGSHSVCITDIIMSLMPSMMQITCKASCSCCCCCTRSSYTGCIRNYGYLPWYLSVLWFWEMQIRIGLDRSNMSLLDMPLMRREIVKGIGSKWWWYHYTEHTFYDSTTSLVLISFTTSLLIRNHTWARFYLRPPLVVLWSVLGWN